MTATFSVRTASGSDMCRTRLHITYRTDPDVCVAVWRSLVRQFGGAVRRGDQRSVAQKLHRRAALVRPVRCTTGLGKDTMTVSVTARSPSGSALVRTHFGIIHRTDPDVCVAVWRLLVRRSIVSDLQWLAAFVWPVRPAICRRTCATAPFSTDRSPSYFSMWWRGFGGRSRDGQVRWRDKNREVYGGTVGLFATD